MILSQVLFGPYTQKYMYMKINSQCTLSHYPVSKTEIHVLWQRFCALGPSYEGILDRSVFQKSPYNEDIFCRQVFHN